MISKILQNRIKKLKKKHNIPAGQITYQDLSKPAKPFFSKRYRVTGKPDYIIKNNNYFIPIEVKTGIYKETKKNHILQLAAYCHLLEENFQRFVPYGLLVYSDKSKHKIPFDPKIRFEFESTIKDMRNTMRTGTITRNHNDLFKCRNCSMYQYCDFKL
ncbi:MAG: hypothetical protein AYK22_07125 [Thermoplasmatales archaeon SG8-52-3]|nr:MAG: hypothetical protein AYK22_07125 [Thermoplasmatales archaeon SG8-52-3]